jgi:pilus assembly protein CpaB
MRRGRTFILLGLLLALLAVLAYFLLARPAAQQPKTVEPTAQAVPTTKIVVAFQNIPRGSQIITGSVGLFDWPVTQVPPNAINDPSKVVGKYAKIDIPQGIPVLPAMYVIRPEEAVLGGAAGLVVQSNRVAVAFPLRSTYPEKENLPFDRRDKDVASRLLSVAYAVQPGDRVDVMACFWIYELDKDFQSRKPNKIGYIDPQNPGQPVEGMAGRPAVAPGGLPAVEGPSEAQLPRMVCQWLVPNARVLGLGDWGVPLGVPTPVAPQQAGGQPTPTPAPPLPQVLTLEVSPQDALVLKYAREAGAQLDMVLRAAGDRDFNITTEAVTLQYLFERFRVSIPPKLDYTVAGGGGVPPVGAGQP